MSLRVVEIALGALTSALLIIVTYGLYRATAKLASVTEALGKATSDLHAASVVSNEIAEDQTRLLGRQTAISEKQVELSDLLYRLNERQLVSGVAPYLVMGQDDRLMRPRLEFTRVTRGEQEPQYVVSLAIANFGQGPAVSVRAIIETVDEKRMSRILPVIDSKEKTALVVNLNQDQGDVFRSAYKSSILTLTYEDILGATTLRRLRCTEMEQGDAEGSFLLILEAGVAEGDANITEGRT